MRKKFDILKCGNCRAGFVVHNGIIYGLPCGGSARFKRELGRELNCCDAPDILWHGYPDFIYLESGEGVKL